MNKKNVILFITTFVFTICLFILTIFNMGVSKAEEKKNPDSYWSTMNPPVLYGASKIQFSNVYTTSFDLLDARFRVLATDFEDGDLTPSITHEGEVDVTTPGTYEITYKVKDRHDNETTLVVPVIVTDEDTKEMVIDRTLYTLPNSDNITKTGIKRSTYHDRQILGIYLPEGEKFYMKTLDSDLDVSVQFDNRAASCEGPRITAKKDGTENTFQNVKNGCGNLARIVETNPNDNVPITTSSVPMVNTISLPASNNEVNKTLKIQIRFNVDEALPLDYYHYKDDLSTFVSKWETSQNLYAIIDSERIMIEVPFDNRSYMYGKFQFSDLDTFFEYYDKIIDTYDSYIGLELNPEDVLNQNVRTKYFIKANVNGAGSAYYSENHIAANSQNMYAFFERNWGGFHEIAHGYQGTLGNGTMNLGEVSNNILAHYAQIDKSIYDDNNDWLGKLPNIEETMIQTRAAYLVATPEELGIQPLKGNVFKMKLYFLVNLFDSYEGITSYQKLNRWYRKQVSFGKTIKNEDAYVEFFANEYKLNIMPYFESYGFYASSSLVDDILTRDLSPVNSLGDVIKDTTTRNSFMEANGMNLKYGVVSNAVLKTSGIKGSLNLTIDIDSLDSIKNKIVNVKSGNDIIKSVIVNSKNITINDLPLGTYLLQMPIINGYSQDYAYVTITDSDNNLTYTYTPYDDYEFPNDLIMKVKGNSETYGYILTFSDNYTKATITYGGALIGANSGAYVKILDENSNEVLFDEAKYKSDSGTPKYDEAGPYFDFKKAKVELNLVPGYTIEVKRPAAANRVFFFSSYNDTTKVADAVSGFETTGSITKYIVEDGYLRREDMTESDAKDAIYEILKKQLKDVIDEYIETTTEEVLENRFSDFKNKSIVMAAYNRLKTADKQDYSEFISKVSIGGKPTIKLIGNTTYSVNDNIDLYSLISASDNEDGVITIDSNNTKITSDLDMSKKGVYTVTYLVNDQDGNTISLDVDITVKEIENLVKDEEEKIPVTKEVKVSPKTEEKTNTSSITPAPNGSIVKEENTTINEEITTTTKVEDKEEEDKKEEYNDTKKEKRKVNTKAYIITSIVLFSILVGVFIAFKRFYVKS